MPKQKITREMVVQAAFELARKGGLEAVLVKSIAARLGCSVQPVYCYCENMPALRQAVIEKTGEFLEEFLQSQVDPADRFRSTGLAHAAFARREPQLYRLYFLRPRPHTDSLEAFYARETDPRTAQFLADTLHLELTQAQRLHLHMLIYNAGLSFLLTSLAECANPEQIADLLDEVMQSLLTTIQKGE